MNSMNDVDAIETREWLDALDSVDAFEGVGRVDELLSDIVQAARLCVPKTLSELMT
jgi:pyruvate dehydrogenase E1 component